MILLRDVNLDEIVLGKDSKSVKFSFIDMYEGNIFGALQCSRVYFFNYQNCFDDGDSLPAYAGEVSYSVIVQSEVSEYLKRSDYNFYGDDIFNNKILVIYIEGGEMSVKVICKAASFNGEELK